MNLALKRRAVQTDNFVDSSFTNVVNYANQKLGYEGVTVEKNRPLGRVLKIAGINPFTIESVNKYKQKKINRVNWFRNSVCSFSCISMIALIYFLGYEIAPPIDSADKASYIFVCGFLSFILSIITLAFLKDKKGQWNLVYLCGYTKEVPAFALATATEIHQRYPEVNFLIDEFIVIEGEKRKMIDPFLVVRAGDETYYVEVWEEPTFKGKRTA